MTINPSSVEFGVTDAAGDAVVSTDGLDTVAVFDEGVSLPDKLDWLVTFCEEANLDDATNGIELELSLVAVAMEDTTPT